jgi:hypothetical protein
MSGTVAILYALHALRTVTGSIVGLRWGRGSVHRWQRVRLRLSVGLRLRQLRSVCAVDVRVSRLHKSETFLHDCNLCVKVLDFYSRLASVLGSVTKTVKLADHLSFLSLGGLDVIDSCHYVSNAQKAGLQVAYPWLESPIC